MSLTNRYDFVLLFDVKDGNPNGDPDAGNLPRMDTQTGKGLVTDVCLKRKIRNYVGIVKECNQPFDIYVKEKAVLGRAHKEAFTALNLTLGEASSTLIPTDLVNEIEEFSLPEGMEISEDEEERSVVIVHADADVKTIKTELKDAKPSKTLKTFFDLCLKNVKARKPKAEEVSKGRDWMCQRFYDIRTFGAVMSLKSAPNCGQVRGPVQLTFARSVDPIIASEHSITRMAVATEAEAEKQSGDNRTMGRKFTVPYGLYVAHGFISAHLADQTGFGEDDLQLLWDALVNMFEHDRSAARGEMSTRGLYVFKHESKLGNAPAHRLFERISPKLKTGIIAARDFSDYEIHVDETNLPPGVELLKKV
ncbi:MAG: type I-C CRISPR-associated protein Cas7/Csd2 [Methylobacter sp.]|uniref:type I-C CRISPR-associated protein Cas7/Csd2 n=1 Tax=Methylobacter sp. TaxID=2051955 RepID=UPI00258F2BC1|nr:type I-C CRISPR-associated protein Cas7/Csd2 [Methylobacter sp.]MCL7419495.1 type I-C CRISPR-associated protein Cas7/Csd2 [Methylobacter sp.]